MTNKERLEDIKDQYHFYVNNGIAFNLEHSDIEKLFMQAERAQELEEIVDKAEAHLLRNGKEIMELTNEKAELVASLALKEGEE